MCATSQSPTTTSDDRHSSSLSPSDNSPTPPATTSNSLKVYDEFKRMDHQKSRKIGQQRRATFNSLYYHQSRQTDEFKKEEHQLIEQKREVAEQHAQSARSCNFGYHDHNGFCMSKSVTPQNSSTRQTQKELAPQRTTNCSVTLSERDQEHPSMDPDTGGTPIWRRAENLAGAIAEISAAAQPVVTRNNRNPCRKSKKVLRFEPGTVLEEEEEGEESSEPRPIWCPWHGRKREEDIVLVYRKYRISRPESTV